MGIVLIIVVVEKKKGKKIFLGYSGKDVKK